MSDTARRVGLVLTAMMFAFSAWMYTQTGDWVAALFAVGSLAYGLFFLSSLAGRVGGKGKSQ
jgi:amino acid permease